MNGHADGNRVAELAPGQCVSCTEPMSSYLANDRYVSSTQLRRFARSGRVAAQQTNGAAAPGTLMGEALHALVLEPEVFREHYLVLDDTQPGQCGMSEGEAMKRHWLNAWQWSTLRHARDALLAYERHPIREWLSDGDKELSIYWRDANGYCWKARPDCFTQRMVIDLKTTSDCRPEPFLRARERFGYDVQAAHYVDAVRRFTGRPPDFAFVAVELSAPYSVWVHVLGDNELAAAQGHLSRLKQAYIAAMAEC